MNFQGYALLLSLGLTLTLILYLSFRNSSNHSGPKLFPESRFLKTISSEKIRLIYGNIRGYENIVKLPLLTDIYENYDRMQDYSNSKNSLLHMKQSEYFEFE